MKQIQKLDALIKRILKEEMASIKEESKINYKKISDEEAVKILNNDKYDIETTVDYDYEYREPATDILMSGDIKANSFDNIGVKEITLSVYKPGATDPFFLIRNVGNRSWTVGMFDLGKVKEANKKFITPDGRTLTAAQKAEMAASRPGDTVTVTKAGEKVVQENEEAMDQQPTGTDIAGQVAEIVEKLKIMSESGKDPKKQRLAEKVMKYMESAKAALEALTGHESMLEEKDQATKEKAAQGHLKAIEKHLGKIVRDKDAVGKMMKKMPIEKVIAMKQQMQSKEKELDEERVAKAMLKYSLQEGWVKYK
jgi:hypothetical protein